MSHSTDVYLACHCDQCHGAEPSSRPADELHLPAGIANPRAGHPRRGHRVPPGSTTSRQLKKRPGRGANTPGQETRYGRKSAALTGRQGWPMRCQSRTAA
jgi:hypothetical protein